MLEELLEWDKNALIYLNGFGSESYDTFWTGVTNFATWIPLFLLIILLLYRKKGAAPAKWILLSLISMLVVLTIIIIATKEGIGRLRPVNDESLNSIIRAVQNPSDFSFFSGHAASSFSIITFVYLFLRKRVKWIALLFLWPILFSLSRVYLGVHYPLDIIVGMLVGIVAAIITYSLHQKVRAPYKG